MFEADDVVWVKPSRTPWWPAQVLHREVWPKMKGKPPRVTCVKYLDEYSFEPVNHEKNIQPFLCPSRQEYQAAGLKCRNSKAFRKALDSALEIVGCSEEEIDTPQSDPYNFDTEEQNIEFCVANGNDPAVSMPSSLLTRGDNCGTFQALILERQEEKSEQVTSVNSFGAIGQATVHESPKQPDVGKVSFESPGRSLYTCEFCGYETTRLNNKIIHDKACSPHKGKFSQKLNLASCSLNPIRLFPSKEEESSVDSCQETVPSVNSSSGCTTAVAKIDLAHNKGRKRSRSAASLDASACRTKSTVACSTETQLSKQGALQKLKEAVQGSENGFTSKRALFHKGSRARTVQNGKKMNSYTSSEGQKNSSATKTAKVRCFKSKNGDVQQSREKLSKVFRLPSENSLLLTPDPIKVGNTPPDMPENDMESMSRSAAFDPNLNEDTCDSESDEELPQGLTPVKPDFELSEGDLVWAQVKGWPYWPAVIRKFYPERKKSRQPAKVSLLFINDGLTCNSSRRRVFCIRCFNSRGKPVVFPFTNSLREKFERIGYASRDKALIEEAVRKVEDFLTKKGLGLITSDALSFFSANSPEYIEPESDEEEKEDMILGMRKRDRVCSRDSRSSVSSIASDVQVLAEIESEEVVVSKSMKTRNEQRKLRCENLVEFIKTDKMKDYLQQIFQGKRVSSLHSSYYASQSERNKIRNPGFGPICDEEQRNEILETLLSWLNHETPVSAGNVDYVMDVWVPEAIVYALISVKKYCRSKAWEMFHKGVRFTKEEYSLAHQAILEAADRISPEDRKMYETKLQQKMEQAMLML